MPEKFVGSVVFVNAQATIVISTLVKEHGGMSTNCCLPRAPCGIVGYTHHPLDSNSARMERFSDRRTSSQGMGLVETSRLSLEILCNAVKGHGGNVAIGIPDCGSTCTWPQ